MIFLDCGFYDGVALEMAIDQGMVTEDWTVYAFEPNKELPVEETMKRFPMKINWIPGAVWIHDGAVPFWISERENASFIEGTSYSGAPRNKIEVPCIDFSKFVSELPDEYIACSMDIEGSEFAVLEKMIEDDTAYRLNFLDIEFHHRFMQDYDAEAARYLIKTLRECGVEVILRMRL